ncbi:hypothetical protein BTO05_10990 [Winogradskyella sp. PC-19]|uniref:hypothetical protein n=1 Tax=Winogradskyella sp. PC-19 TaxID=754417 RepID=UPI000B3C0757|nr:hypothetical protein [Winogradskyella sp. PC-19]ARV10136.1 hypothetical protein BTO05_10990 [Winogradskyella sp. PC-19]
MSNIQYKKEAQNLYKSNKLFEAYSCAWKLSFSDFITWYTNPQKRRGLSKSQTFFNNSFFYNSFLITKPPVWLQHNDAILLWHHYLDSQKEISLEFELYVAHNNAILFIEGYKNRKTFLDSSRIKLLERKQLPEPIINELKIWDKFNNILNSNWSDVLQLTDKINAQPHELCMSIFSAFEAFIYQDSDNKSRWYFAVEALSLLVAFIQNTYDFSDISVDSDTLNKSYLESVINPNAIELFNKTFDYVLCRNNVYRYAHEPGLNVVFDENNIVFKESEDFNKQWQRDEYRYSVNENLYYAFGEQLFDEVKKNEKIKFINGNKDSNNQLGNARQFAIKQAIIDLGVHDEDLKNCKLPNLNLIISFMHGIAWRKLETSEKPLHKISRTRRNKYSQGIAELNYKSRFSEFIIISDKSILFQAAEASGLNLAKREFDQLIDAFSFNWIVKKFDPITMPLSLWQKPFVKLGKHVLSPLSVLTGFTGLYTISESILKNFRPGDGTRIENRLKEVYQNTSWKTLLLEDNQEFGDIDVLMEDEKSIVLMQMKRTTQKTNMFELHNQLRQDKKAFSQLLEAKESIDSNKNIHLWYVTTAFEKVGTWENDVYRVSYQDLIHTKRLLDSGRLRLKSLSSFIEMIESDYLYNLRKQDT